MKRNFIPDADRRAFLKSAGLVGGGLLLPGLATATPSSALDQPRIADTWADASAHGIVNDGRTLNTEAIDSLIARLAAAGGGTLYFGPGDYLTGPIHLRSNITLYLEAGATLRFSENFDDYLPMVPTRFQGLGFNGFSPLIYAHNVKNIAIVGRGTVDGRGAVWWDYQLKLRAQAKLTPDHPPTSKWQDLTRSLNEQPLEQLGFMRPPLLQTLNTGNVRLQGVHFVNSPFWTLHFVESENIVVDGIQVTTPDSPNTDGINPESSRNVHIANCHIHTDDDCVTIKAGKNAWGRAHASACENITITNCVMTAGAAGVGIGSEMSGGVRRVTVSNCVFDGTGHGVHIKSVRGRGGIVEDIAFSNIVMHNIHRHPAIHLNLKYWTATAPAAVDEGTPAFRNISFTNIRGSGLRRAVDLAGLEERFMENISFDGLNLEAEEGIVAAEVDGLRFSTVRLVIARGPAVSCRNVERLMIDGLDCQQDDANVPIVQLDGVRHAALSRIAPFTKSDTTLSVSGSNSRSIRFSDLSVPDQSESVKLAPDVPAGAVTP